MREQIQCNFGNQISQAIRLEEKMRGLNEARIWVKRFVDWYNNEHRHSEINFVTPASKHRGEDFEILHKRVSLYEEARSRNPQRWSKNTRKWNPVTEVHLNPTKEMRQQKQNQIKTAA